MKFFEKTLPPTGAELPVGFNAIATL